MSTGRINGAHISSTLLIVDGNVMVDQEQGRPLLENINTTAIEEIQVITGTYSAEYGNGRAGVILVTTRDAFQMSHSGQKFWASAHVVYTPGHLTWFETPGGEPDGDSLAAMGCYTAYGPNSNEWLMLGSELSLDSSQYYVSDTGWLREIKPWSRFPNLRNYTSEDLQRIWMYQHRVGVDSLGGRQPGSTPEYVVEGALGFPIHRTVGLVISGQLKQKAWAIPYYEPKFAQGGFNVKLNLRPFENLFVDLQYGLGKGKGRSPAEPTSEPEDINPWTKYLLDNMNIGRTRQETWSASARYAPWSTTLMEVRASHLSYDELYNETPPFDDPIPDRYRLLVPGSTILRDFVDTVNVYWLGNPREGYVRDGTYRDYWIHNGTYQSQGLIARLSDDPHFIVSTSGSATLNSIGGTITSQVTKGHRLTAGGKREVVTAGGVNDFPRWRMGTRIEGYVMDHITVEQLIADVGLRMDGRDGRLNWFFPVYPMQYLWSPRFGLSHPITDKMRIYYNYGHFYDIPPLILTHEDLVCPRTIQYEVALDRDMWNLVWLHVGGWNRSRDRGFSRTYTLYIDDEGHSARDYERSNNLYSHSYGISLRAEWFTRFFSGYFFHERALATTEFLTKTEIDLRPPPYSTGWVPAEQSSHEPTQGHTSMLLRFMTPYDFRPWGISPMLAGGYALAIRWETTPPYKILFDPDASGELPVGASNLWVRGRSLWHMRLEKGVEIGHTRLTAFLDIRNLFNSRRFNYEGFYRGYAEFSEYVFSLQTSMTDQFLQGPPREGWATDGSGRYLPTGNDMVGDVPEYAYIPQFDRWAMWLDPRFIRVGMRIDF